MDAAKLIAGLSERGADIKGAMERFLDDEDLYVTCVGMFAADKGFSMLDEALKAGDVKKAFEAAHSLKGLSANLGLIPLFETMSAMTETLRAGSLEGLEAGCEEALRWQRELEALLAS